MSWNYEGCYFRDAGVREETPTAPNDKQKGGLRLRPLGSQCGMSLVQSALAQAKLPAATAGAGRGQFSHGMLAQSFEATPFSVREFWLGLGFRAIGQRSLPASTTGVSQQLGYRCVSVRDGQR